jgi:hypothetical protein
VNMYILTRLTPEFFLQERNRILRLRLAAAKVHLYTYIYIHRYIDT